MRPHALLAALLVSLGPPVLGAPAPTYINWRTFHATGVNLGGWLEQETSIDTIWWAQHAPNAPDEWTLCATLGPNCARVLEHRYSTLIQEADIDNLAAAGISLLRIPTTYAAWIKLPGSQLYSGRQQAHLRRIASYAIARHGMHVVIDLHSLPGGTNGLDIGEATGHYGWWGNQTALEWSLKAIDAVVEFVQTSGHPQAYTIEPINEPADNRDFSAFGTPAALSDEGAKWLVKYFRAVLERVGRVDKRIPVMLQGSFKPEKFWSGYFEEDANVVFDLHHYYWQYANSTSSNLPVFICKDARESHGDSKFPTFVGEWAIEAGANNSLALRERNVRAGIEAFGKFTRGCSYWTAKYRNNATIAGHGRKENFWNFEEFIQQGYFDGTGKQSSYCH